MGPFAADATNALHLTSITRCFMRVTSFFLVFPARAFQGFVGVKMYPPPMSRSCGHRFATNINENAEPTTRYYLLKSEPSEFSIYDLEKAGDEEWDGVRNFQARNIMRTMKVGDRTFFYHSSCKEVGIVGTAVITREAQPDITAYQDPNHKGYDPKSTKDNCRWDAVQVRVDRIYPVILTLKELKAQAQHDDKLQKMTLFQNSRLSVHQLSAEEWTAVEALVERKVAGEDLIDVP